jgi:hypothetical protein
MLTKILSKTLPMIARIEQLIDSAARLHLRFDVNRLILWLPVSEAIPNRRRAISELK